MRTCCNSTGERCRDQRSIRASEAKISANRERIAGHEATLDHERRRAADLEQEIARHRQRLVQMNARAGDLKQQLAETAEAVEAAEEHRGRIAKNSGRR